MKLRPGTYYDQVVMDLSKVSGDAAFYQRALDRMTKGVPGKALLTSSDSTITIWFADDQTCMQAINYLVVNGVRYEYRFYEYIEEENYAIG